MIYNPFQWHANFEVQNPNQRLQLIVQCTRATIRSLKTDKKQAKLTKVGNYFRPSLNFRVDVLCEVFLEQRVKLASIPCQNQTIQSPRSEDLSPGL